MKKGKESDIVNYIIGFNLAARRRELGIAIEQVSKWSGITVEELTDFEKGVSRPAANILVDFGKCLDVPPSYFFKMPENLGSTDRTIIEGLNRTSDNHDLSVSDGVAVIKAFARIKNQERRKVVLDIAELMAKSGPIK